MTIHIWPKTWWLQISVEWLYDSVQYNSHKNMQKVDIPSWKRLSNKFGPKIPTLSCPNLQVFNFLRKRFVYCIRLTNPVQNPAHKNLYCHESWTMQMWLKKKGGIKATVLIAPIPYLSQAVNHLCCTMNYHLLHL